MITKIELGERIASARKRAGISQAQLGVMFGNISHAAISDIERGRTNLGIEDISKIANLLNVSFEDLTLDYKTLSRSITQFRSTSDVQKNMEINKSVSDFEALLTGMDNRDG